GREERNVPLREHQESRRVGADSEKGDVAEGRIAGIAADEVPALRHECQAEDGRVGQQLVRGDDSRQQKEPSKDDREENVANGFRHLPTIESSRFAIETTESSRAPHSSLSSRAERGICSRRFESPVHTSERATRADSSSLRSSE